MPYLLYFLFIPFAAIFVGSIHAGGYFLLIPIVLVFAIVPAFDLLLGLRLKNPTPDQNVRWRKAKFWAPPLFLYGLTHFAFLIFAAWEVFRSNSYLDATLTAIVAGIYLGAFGINAAHELMHRRDLASKTLSNFLLASVCYQHFYIEHLYGHHLLVSTPEDPASARRGESIFKFLPRTLFGSYFSAWKIETRRSGGFTLRNRLVQGHLLMALFFAGFAFLGGREVLFFGVQSATAILLLELVNYIEHYGLSRTWLEGGRYERVQPKHSWNSSHVLSNLLLFNLQFHSDHHANAGLPFTVLRHDETAPQLPSGYPAMILLALLPALWFKIMDKKLIEWDRSNAA